MKLDLSLEFLMILFLGEIETKIDFFLIDINGEVII